MRLDARKRKLELELDPVLKILGEQIILITSFVVTGLTQKCFFYGHLIQIYAQVDAEYIFVFSFRVVFGSIGIFRNFVSALSFSSFSRHPKSKLRNQKCSITIPKKLTKNQPRVRLLTTICQKSLNLSRFSWFLIKNTESGYIIATFGARGNLKEKDAH